MPKRLRTSVMTRLQNRWIWTRYARATLKLPARLTLSTQRFVIPRLFRTQIIISCMFHHIEGFCPSSDSSEQFQTFVKQIDWRLPAVVWDWKASPPPPPGLLKRGPLARIAVYDPEGFALAEQALDDFFPALEYVASKSTGSRIRNKYGPKYFVNKYELSMAFMAAENFEVRAGPWRFAHSFGTHIDCASTASQDKNSISARMIQARFTNFGRFSCIAMLEFASDRDNAAAGMTQPVSARLDNPADYNSPWDRNWILYFATVFAESLQKEVGRKANFLEVNVLEFWQQQCEEPAAYRAPVPTSMWSSDPKRLGTTDAFDTSVEVRDFAPLVSFGSLRQLRAVDGPAAVQWPEDATTSLLFAQNTNAINQFGSSDTTDYGRRMGEDAAPNASAIEWTADDGLHYRDEADNVSITTGPRPAPGTTRRGRGLFMNFVIKGLIKKALGNVLEPDPYKRIDKQFEFEVPNSPRPHFYYDRLARQTNVAKDLLRDVYCNPDYELTVEQVVGNPAPHAFTDTIVDSSTQNRPRDMITYGNLRGGDVNRGYQGNGPGGQTPSYKDTSLQSWVYITSSDDPNVEMFAPYPIELCVACCLTTTPFTAIVACVAVDSTASPTCASGRTRRVIE